MPDYNLKTKNLLLRPITNEDAPLLWPYVSNPEISRDMSWHAHKSIDETKAFIETSLKSMTEGKTITWCIFYKNTFCGIFSVISILRTHRSLTYDRAELAYWIGPEFQGKGIMTEAGSRIIDFTFNELRLNKLTVGHHVSNERSRNLILRLGFKLSYEEKAVFNKDGRWIDCYFYELQRRDYEKNEGEKSIFVCPQSHESLFLKQVNDSTYLRGGSGVEYSFAGEFPDLTFPRNLSGKEQTVLEFYENRAEVYDKFLYQTFKTHNEDENKTRNNFIDKLNINASSKVLEIACGTGRDSALIANRLGKDGQLVLQDISPSMLKVCKKKLAASEVDKLFCVSNAAYLPFPDNYFDATYSFGGLGEFPEIKRSLAEMVRVTKIGGKIVVGDESMPPWLRDTYFCKVLSKTNPQFLAEVPIKDIPVDARKVNIQWVIGGVFYLIDFEVGEGEPKGDFDYEVEGPRGGTLRTRMEGELEGVTKEAKQLAFKAAKAKGLSMHKWLDNLVTEAAKKDLGI